MSRVRNICFTLNNYDAKDEEYLKNLECQYIIYGKEVAPTTGTPHLQGYIQFKEKRSLSVLGSLLRWNIRKANGSDINNYNYCSKDKLFYERGQRKAQGRRTDIKSVVEQVKSGSTMRELIEECSNYQTIRIAEKVMMYFEQPREWFTYNYYFYGNAGAGKSRLARKILGKNLHPQGAGKFWNKYDGQENILLDDFRKDWYPLYYLLQVLDRYPMVIEVKGGSRQLRAKIIIITSDKPPWELWHGNDLDQVMRRLSLVARLPNSLGLLLP